MRLDKYLKVSRLIKRRTVANEACDNGRISVNGRVVKASYEVKVGDKIEISMGTRTVAVEVLQISETVRKDDATAMYTEELKIRTNGDYSMLWHEHCDQCWETLDKSTGICYRGEDGVTWICENCYKVLYDKRN